MVIKVGDIVRRKKGYAGTLSYFSAGQTYEVIHAYDEEIELKGLPRDVPSSGWFSGYFEVVKSKTKKDIPWL